MIRLDLDWWADPTGAGWWLLQLRREPGVATPPKRHGPFAELRDAIALPGLPKRAANELRDLVVVIESGDVSAMDLPPATEP